MKPLRLENRRNPSASTLRRRRPTLTVPARNSAVIVPPQVSVPRYAYCEGHHVVILRPGDGGTDLYSWPAACQLLLELVSAVIQCADKQTGAYVQNEKGKQVHVHAKRAGRDGDGSS